MWSDVVNITVALLTIVLGCFGFLAPRYTMGALALKEDGSSMGLSEIRASVGCLFVALGIGCLVLGTAEAYFMMGVAYVGAATGRLVSLFLDNPPRVKAFVYFAVEAALALPLVLLNG
jgi:hypothetical protein